MANRNLRKRILVGSLTLVMALSMIVSACIFYGGNGSSETSLIRLIQDEIKTNRDKYLNSNLLYKLPENVRDTDELSIIVQTKKDSLLDTYQADERDISFTEYVYSEEAKGVSSAIAEEKAALLSLLNEAGLDYTEGADYQAIFGGFEVKIVARDFEALCKAVGDRAKVIVGDEYKTCETQLVENKVNVYDTGIFDSSDFGYDGTGTVVAVLDTGLDYNHTAFSVNNFTADRNKLGTTFADVQSFINDTTAAKLHGGLTAADVYLNEKVPFAFDYADYDPDVYPMTPNSAADHGTHVAGVIAGKDDVITGVAPNAQLAIMKIFSDTMSTSKSAWILTALEDCVVLGVDVINMSIGTSCGFSRESDKEALSGVYDRIRATGISMVVAASNSFNSTYGSEKNGNLGLTSNPDSATVGSPSTYEGAMSVASISGKKTPYILYNDTIIYFTESTDRIAEEKNFYDDIMGKDQNEITIEYVTIPGAGRSADYNGIDVTGKVALVRRGSTTFEEKANVAQAKGAKGIIIYNNVSGDIKMNVGDATLAVCSIGQDNGELLAAAGTGTLTLKRSQTSGPFMSDFSSWGPTPDLGIKPEITAHGGEIYSAVPGQSYDHQSGTSMACPNIAGVTALLRQYVVENFTDVAKDPVKVTALVNQLMMSTADIVYNTNGLPYAVRKQGAGLANLHNVAKTKAYILTYKNDVEMDKSKLELGDDPSKSGVYTLSFAVKNFGSTDLSYAVGVIVMTEGVSATLTNQGETTVDEQGYLLSGANVAITTVENATQNGMNITVGAGQTAKVTVTVALSDADKKYLDDSFENGMYVEGFVTLDAADENVVDLSVPYLAFYGDWTQAPIFDLDFYATNKDELDDGIDLLDKTLPDAYATRPIGSLEQDFVSFLGSFYFTQDPSTTQIAADRKYISLSNQEGSVHELAFVWGGLLRNCAKIEITITDDTTGEVVFQKTENDIRKSYGDGGSIYPANIKVGFDAYEENLKNNTKYTVKLQGYVDYGDGGLTTNKNNTFEFPLTTDFLAPAVTDCEFYTEYDRSTKKTRYFAKMAVYDNHYTMALQVGYVENLGTADAPDFMLQSFQQYLTPVYCEENATSYVVYELTDYLDDIRKNSHNRNTFTVAAYDYALNTATYEIALPDEFLSFYFAEGEKIEYRTNDDGVQEAWVTLSPNEIFDLEPVVYPGTEWGRLLEYVSTNTKVAHIVNNKLVPVAKGQTVVIARDPATQKQVYLNVTVLGEGDEGYRRYDKTVTDNFYLTGYLTEKAYYFVSTDQRDIGTTGDEMKFTSKDHYSMKMFPSESVTLRWYLDAYYPDITKVTFSSSNENLVKIDEKGTITAVAEGYASVTVNVMMKGDNGEYKSTFYSQSINIEIKDPYTNSGSMLTGYFGLGGVVEIPESLSLTQIGQFAFSNFDYVPKEPHEYDEDDPSTTKQWFIGENTITKVIIPEGVKTINSYAFANLTALTEVVLPSTMERIDQGAFLGCTSLTKVTGIENVKFINEGAFAHCALKESISLDNATVVADSAFAGNTKLTSVILSDKIQSIGISAFAGNTALESVTIEADMVKLGQSAFDGCSALKKITINAAVIPALAFNECTSLEEITLGKDVTVIGEYAFSNAKATTIHVDPANTTFYAKEGGKYLTNEAGDCILFVAPGVSGAFSLTDNTVTSVGNNAFSGNTKITSVHLPSVTTVGNYAFAYCQALKEITLGHLTDMGDYAFYRTKISTVPALDALVDKTIGAYAFAYTEITELTVLDGMTVGDGAFRECKKLAAVTIGDLVTVGADAFRLDRETNFTETPGSYRDENGNKIFYYVYTSPLHSLTIGDNVTLGSAAFMGAAELTSVTLGEGVTIGDQAFYNAVMLKDIDLSKVISIGAGAFSGDVTYEFVDESMQENAYTEDMDYRYHYYAPALTSVDLSALTFLGEDAFSYCEKLTSVTLGDGVTAIPARAFQYCGLLTEIDLSAVISVGENAFCETALTTVDLSSATEIGKYAFVYNEELTKIILNAAGVTLDEGAFAYCATLTDVDYASAITEVGAYAFAYTGITAIDLSGATAIGDHAFLKEKLTDLNVVLGDSLTDLGENPFAMCRLPLMVGETEETFNGETFTKPTNTFDISETVKVIDGILYRVVPNGLELIAPTGTPATVRVAEGTTRISAYAFASSDVAQVILPLSLKSIGHKAFYGCEKLALVSFTSYKAPILEEEYDYSYWLSAENLPATGEFVYTDLKGENLTYQGLGIVPYFMWNATSSPAVIYYGANFVDYIGHADGNLTMIKPVNGKYYDSFLYGQYFDVLVEGAAAPDDVTLAAIEAINNLPENITLADKPLVEAARAAYARIGSKTQQSLVTNLEVLEKAEKRIADLEYIQGGDNLETETETTVDTETEPSVIPEEEDGADFWIAIAILGVVVVALAAVCIVQAIGNRRKAEKAFVVPDEEVEDLSETEIDAVAGEESFTGTQETASSNEEETDGQD